VTLDKEYISNYEITDIESRDKMIKSVKKALDILTILSNSAEDPITLSELAEKTNLNKSTCAHIVDTMCEELYVERVSRKEGYRLGPWSYMLSRYGSYYNSLSKLAYPILKWLHKQLDTAVFLSVVCNGRKYIILHIDPDNILPMSDGSMIQGYLETTATGRLLMAFMDSETFHYTLAKRADESKRDILTPELEAELKKIRMQGYSYCSIPSEKHQSYAFKVMDGEKNIASLGVLYFDLKDSPEYREKVIKSGKIAAAEISRRKAFE
jgi:DNA-binding IclR family transcriptional regulator